MAEGSLKVAAARHRVVCGLRLAGSSDFTPPMSLWNFRPGQLSEKMTVVPSGIERSPRR
jgi:hypothetical protein